MTSAKRYIEDDSSREQLYDELKVEAALVKIVRRLCTAPAELFV